MRLSLSRVRRCVVRQVMSTTRPSVPARPPTRIQSLMRNGRSTVSTRPAKKLPRIGCKREAEDQRGDGAGRQQRRDAHVGERDAEDQQRDDEIRDQERDADEERRQAQPAAGLQVDLEVVEADDAQQRRAEEERHQPDEERVEGDDVLRPEPEEDPHADRGGADDQREGEQPEQAHVAPQQRDQSEEGRRGGDSGEESEDEIHALNEPYLPNPTAPLRSSGATS